MSIEFTEYAATIGAHFMSALVNGDLSDVNARESRALTAWLSDYPNAIFDEVACDEFTRCEISGLFGDCVKIKILVPKLATISK